MTDPTGTPDAAADPAPHDPRLAAATPADVDRVVTLVHELAAYEKAAPGECSLTAPALHEALFGAHPTVFGLVARPTPDRSGEVVGFALYFRIFSTWTGGPGFHLEDLYLTPAHRGTGLGRALVGELAARAVRLGYARVEWNVLDWNAPAIAFYRSLRAAPLDGWTTHRLTGAALAGVAAGAGSAAGDPGPATPTTAAAG